MIIYRPIQSNRLTQSFGENKACVRLKDGQPIRPFQVVGTQSGTCPANTIPFYQAINMKGHNGWDHATWNGEPLYFPVDAGIKWWSRSSVDADGGVGVDIFSSTRVYLEELPPQAGKLARKEWEENQGYV